MNKRGVWLLGVVLSIGRTQASHGEKQNLASGIASCIHTGIAQRVFPGAVVLVARGDQILYHEPFGRHTYEPDAPVMTRDTLFDIASITKCVATMPVAMLLADAGVLDLDESVGRYMPRVSGSHTHHVKIRHLLTHTAGFQGDISTILSDRDALERELYTISCAHTPGTICRYSCRTMLLLQKILQELIPEPFQMFVKKRIYDPLGMADTGYLPIDCARCAPTAPHIPPGTVYDPNARMLGGVAGNSGVFSTAYDLYLFARMLLNQGHYQTSQGTSKPLIRPETVKLFTRPHEGGRGLGCELGRHLGLDSYGHFGWVGTSMWIDPTHQLIVIFLTNRSYQDGCRSRMREIREQLHDHIWQALGYPPVLNRPPPPPLI